MWFSAIYILLFVSLIGCIVPRTGQFVGQLRGRPPGAPRKLDPAARVHHLAHRRRPRAGPRGRARHPAQAALPLAHRSGDAVAAEKGYLRETGNLLFHIALIVMLVAFAGGQLFKSEGGKLVVEGDGFANTITQYDDFKSGSLFDNDDLAPFSFDLDDFVGTYERSGPQRGTPRTYEARVTYSEGADGEPKKKVIEVNKPLVVDGTKVYLNAPRLRPGHLRQGRQGQGGLPAAPVPLLPIDNNVTSTGAIKVMDGYRDTSGKKDPARLPGLLRPDVRR